MARPGAVENAAPFSSHYPYATAPAPGVTAPPEAVPARYAPAGVSLTSQSSGRALAVQLGKPVTPELRQVSFRLVLTLGADFASRLDRSIRLLGPDNIRYLVDEPATEPSLLGEAGPALDGWVTFLLPAGLTGNASIHIALDPSAPLELVLPVVIGDGVPQLSVVATPQSISAPVGADVSKWGSR